MMEVDYKVYLVTDSTMIPESSTFLKQVEDSVEAGATIVQLREKSIPTLDFIERARKVHEITKKKGIPLIINDRIDVALAIDAEGVHVGQDDMPATLARKLIGPNKILGVTCSNPEEVEIVCKENVADYVGIGTVYKTMTKTDTKTPLGAGPIGLRSMLQVLKKRNSDQNLSPIKCVAIGGINETNVSKVMFQCAIEGQKLDGVAVVSCIMAKPDAYKATIELKQQIDNPMKLLKSSKVEKLPFNLVRKTCPLVHHITNNVVKNFSANVTLAIGASPVMSELSQEFEEFAANVPDLALVLNVGTPSEEQMQMFIHAINIYNKYDKPIVFDPVAVGATTARLNASRTLLNSGHLTVIKGNVGEIAAIWKLCSTYEKASETVLMRGVDSVSTVSVDKIINMAFQVSADFKSIVIVTGAKNYIVDAHNGHQCVVQGGSELMGQITGTGCSLGSTVAAFLASKGDSSDFNACVAAVTLYNEAGRKAGSKTTTPGDFHGKFIDALYLESK